MSGTFDCSRASVRITNYSTKILPNLQTGYRFSDPLNDTLVSLHPHAYSFFPPSDACRAEFYLAASADGAFDEQYVDKCEVDATGNSSACCSCPIGALCAESSTIESIKVERNYYR